MFDNIRFLRPLGHRLGPALIIVALLLLAGCGSWTGSDSTNGQAEDDLGGRYSIAAARSVFSVGYEHISDIYIEPKKISDLALHGLRALASIDQAVGIERTDTTITVTAGGAKTSFPAPGDRDARGWGILTAAAIEFVRSHSPDVAKTDSERLYKIVFDAIVSDLDRFSRYADAASARDNRANREGFGGVGIVLDVKDGTVRIDQVMPETPAEAAGLRQGDRILGIDGTPILNADERTVVNLLRGQIGAAVDLSIERAGQSSFSMRLIRSAIIPQTVIYRKEPGNIAYFRLTGFNRQSTATMNRLLQRARTDADGKLAGIVLDLRNNPGGLLDQGVGVSDLFLRRGRILTTKGRVPESMQVFDSSGQDVAEGVPLVVLINRGSASAAEIVAAALQDQGRALLVGTRSFGKGTVQTVLRLPNEGELTLTWARFFAPSGYALQGIGVVPNICTTDAKESMPQVLAEIRAGHVSTISAITQRRAADRLDQADQLALASQCPASKQDADGDSDLEIARAVLTEPGLYTKLMRTFQVATGLSAQAAAH